MSLFSLWFFHQHKVIMKQTKLKDSKINGKQKTPLTKSATNKQTLTNAKGQSNRYLRNLDSRHHSRGTIFMSGDIHILCSL